MWLLTHSWSGEVVTVQSCRHRPDPCTPDGNAHEVTDSHMIRWDGYCAKLHAQTWPMHSWWKCFIFSHEVSDSLMIRWGRYLVQKAACTEPQSLTPIQRAWQPKSLNMYRTWPHVQSPTSIYGACMHMALYPCTELTPHIICMYRAQPHVPESDLHIWSLHRT